MRKADYPIKHWSYSSLMTYLRNPLAWYKRYVEEVYDTPATPASAIGRAGHAALEHFYSAPDYTRKRKGRQLKEISTAVGKTYLESIPDFEVNFGTARTQRARKKKRLAMERDYERAIGFYLKRAPQHKVLGTEVKITTRIPGIPIPVKAISDIVVESQIDPEAVDIIDHKFVSAFSHFGKHDPSFILQALFNYYTVLSEFEQPVRRFIVFECKKTKNRDGKSQLRRHSIDFNEYEEYFPLFHRLLRDASKEIRERSVFLPNPSDMFEGANSFEIYRLGLGGDSEALQ